MSDPATEPQKKSGSAPATTGAQPTPGQQMPAPDVKGSKELTPESGDGFFAWSPIQYGAETDDKGNFLRAKTIDIGSSVTQDQLGVSDADWRELVQGGAVRQYPYPDDMPDNWTGSPVDWLKHKARLVEQSAQLLTSGLQLQASLGAGAKR